MHKLALGTAQFGMPYGIANKSGQVSLDEAKVIIELAAENWIDTIDTAISYGESEECLGQAGVGGFKVVTKLPYIPDNVTDVERWISQHVDASLHRLKISNLYGILLHRSHHFIDESVREALVSLKESGKVQKIGVSIYSPSELEVIPVIGTLGIVQAPLNLVDRRLVTSGWLKRLTDNGIEVHTRSAFLQGLLVMPQKSIPNEFSAWNSIWVKWYDWLDKMNISAVQACLEFVLSFQDVDKVVVGVETADQLIKLIEASQVSVDLDFPEIATEEEKLINPSYWPSR